MSRKKNIKKEFDLPYDARDISIHITGLRKAEKMTRYQLAMCAQLKESVIMRIEKGICEPKLNTLLKIIGGLDISMADFFRNFTEH